MHRAWVRKPKYSFTVLHPQPALGSARVGVWACSSCSKDDYVTEMLRSSGKTVWVKGDSQSGHMLFLLIALVSCAPTLQRISAATVLLQVQLRKVHLELLYLLPVTKSCTHGPVYQFARLPGMGRLCRHSSPLVPPSDAFFALGGVLALGGVAVLLGVVFE